MGLRRRTNDPSYPYSVMDSRAVLGQVLHKTQDTDWSRLNIMQIAQMNEYSEVFWAMRRLGEEERAKAARTLYHNTGAPWTPNPRGPISFSLRTLLAEVARQHGIVCENMQTMHRGMASALRPNAPVFAYLQTFPQDESAVPPHLVAETDLASQQTWTFHAAMVLGLYILNERMLSGYGMPGGVLIFPPDPDRDAHMCSLTHQFTKGLFALGEHCDADAKCSCERIMWLYAHAPAGHPEVTAELHYGRPPTFQPVRYPNPTTPGWKKSDSGEIARAWRRRYESDPDNVG